MFPEWTILMATLQALRGRLDRARQPRQGGFLTVEWMVLVAVLVGIALVVGVVLLSRIRAKARSIPLG